MVQSPEAASLEAKHIWDSVLQLLRKSNTLTARDKGWLEDISPEAVFGSTIVLCVSNKAAQEAVQDTLNGSLLDALQAVSGVAMFPAIKIVKQLQPTSKVEQTTSMPSAQPSALAQADGQSDSNIDTSDVTASKDSDTDQHHDISGQKSEDTEFTLADPIIVPEHIKLAPADDRMSTSASVHTAAQSTSLQHPDISEEPAHTFDGRTPLPFSMPSFPVGQQKVERDPETHLNTNATFDTFVPGDSNRFARTVALAVAEGSGRDFNPLCIYGSSGLGKTHLLNAIGNYALVKDPSLKVRYVNSEEFTNEFIDALQNSAHGSGQIAEFNHRYRQVDVLLIDDIQFLGGKEATLDQFFHTFNALHDANKRIVIASDVQPKNLKGFEQRLISRFDSGLTVDVKPPDRETRVAILRMMSSNSGARIPNEVLDLIAERFTENIRELEGALTRVTAVASLNGQNVTKTLAEQTLQDFFTTDVEIKPTDIITQVAQYFHLTFDDLVGRTRTKNIALARQIAMYLGREMTSMSLVDIGEVFGGRDHTTVMHAYTRISGEMQEKREIYNYVMELTVRLKQHPIE
ncbi:MAG: chromosomal replication initiator protein DnaA [Bifidobacterium aquikefiri]|uniref:Chromosomal replication initiator protein DnaA n=1 Tax=Bifidobacterium aquikefiri TaxID=1653207 RepID=A0A261GBF5_9BIFI|nr:chromosomal replication initiator protein DnaA [Bifidobacterium aquikefiri]OZG68734.1 chromosomal replication initiator protein DnaA [Bifidobacterium aquikefiri]